MSKYDNLKIGMQFIGKPKVMVEPRVFAFSGGPFNSPGWPASNIHTDLKFAQSAGLTTRAVSATQFQSYLIDMLIDLFGMDWFKHGHIDSKFIKTVDVGDTITSKLSIISKISEGDKLRINLEAWCENQNSQKVLIGTASCLLSER